MDEEVVSVLSTGQVNIEYRGGDHGELVSIYNLPGNTNRVFFRLNGDATTSEDAVSPSEYSPPLLLTQKQNSSGINIIAETGTTSVRVFRTPFRSRLERLIAQVGLWAGLTASFWRAISGTQIALKGAFVEARADTVRAKTTGQPLVLSNDQGNASLVAAAGANGGSIVRADGTGQAQVLSSDDTDGLTVSTGGPITIARNSINLMGFTDTESSFRKMDTAPVVLYDGAGTGERHRFNSTDQISRMVGDGASSQVMGTREWVIENGQTINANDLVERSTTNPFVRAAQVGSTLIIGQAVSGGTGDAGGTVKAVVRVRGMLVGSVVADNAGVTQFQRALGGATDLNQIASQAAIEGTFAMVLETGASGVAIDLDYYGGL